MIIRIISVIAAVVLFILYEHMRRKLHGKTDYLRRPEIRCEAEILDVNTVTYHDSDGKEVKKKAAIISFRSGKSTVVHRYTRRFFRLYRRGDKVILYYDSDALYSSVERLAKEVIAKERRIYKGVSANIDFYSGFVYSMLNLPTELYTPLFAIARISGWSAHRIEELINCGKIIRPAYKNVQPQREYIALSDR